MRDETKSSPLREALPMFIDHAERQDCRTARLIYQAQALRRRFGSHVALIFLTTMQVPSKIRMRVLNLTDKQLRR